MNHQNALREGWVWTSRYDLQPEVDKAVRIIIP